MPPPLIDARWRRPALGAIAAGAAVVLVLSIMLFRARTTGFDTWVFTELDTHVGRSARAALLGVTDPWLATGLLAGVAVIAALARRWDVAALAVLAPLLALGVTEWLLKPLIGRTLGPSAPAAGPFVRGCFPSGHETGVAATALVLLVAAGQVPLRRAHRVVVAVLLGLWVGLAAIGLVRNHFHYATDTIGAVGVATAVVLASALLIERRPARFARRVPVSAGDGLRAR